MASETQSPAGPDPLMPERPEAPERPEVSEQAAVEAFRRAGLPFTIQRRAIWQSLAGNTDHPTADDVRVLVEGKLPGVSRTTIYRSLEAMVKLGLIARIGHPGAAVRFDPRTSRHHHLICEECGAVFDYDDSALDELKLPGGAAQGFTVRDFSVLLVGRCADC